MTACGILVWWQGIDAQGRIRGGYVMSESLVCVRLRLNRLPIVVVACRLSMVMLCNFRWWPRLWRLYRLRQPLSLEVVARICESLATLLRSGLSLHQALIITASSIHDEQALHTCLNVSVLLRAGCGVHEAFAHDEHRWPELFPLIVGYSEGASSLAERLDECRVLYQEQQASAAAIRQNIALPLLTAVVAVGVLGAAAYFFFSLLDADALPAWMSVCAQVGLFVFRHGEWLCVGVMVGIGVGLYAYRRMPRLQMMVDMLSAQLFGMARYQAVQLRMVAMLVRVAVPFEEAWLRVGMVMPHRYWRHECVRFHAMLVRGESLPRVCELFVTTLFPHYFLRAVGAVTDAASLALLCRASAESVQQSLMVRMQWYARLIPVVIITLVAVVVGMLFSAVYAPLLQSMSTLG